MYTTFYWHCCSYEICSDEEFVEDIPISIILLLGMGIIVRGKRGGCGRNFARVLKVYTGTPAVRHKDWKDPEFTSLKS